MKNSLAPIPASAASNEGSSSTSPRRKFYRKQQMEDSGYIWEQVPASMDHETPDIAPPEIRVVLADDHQIVVQGLQNMLQGQGGIEITGVASNSRESLSLLHEKRPDILLTDLNMPGINGLDMLTEIRRDFPDLRIVVLSMYRDARIRKGLKKLNIAAYLLKNTSQQDLITVLQKVAQDQPVAMPQINHLEEHGYDVDLGMDSQLKDNFIERFSLGKRELEILKLIAQGKSSQAIADGLFISIETVHSHRKNIKVKTGLKNSAEVAAFAVRNGLV